MNTYIKLRRKQAMSRPKLFSEIKGQVHDASGIDNPYYHYWEQVKGIWHPMVGSKKPEVYARKCDITGKGFNEGYCFGDGEEYAIDEASAIKIARNRGYETFEDAFDDGDYYYSDWIPDPDNEVCYDEDGNVVSVPEGYVVKPMKKADTQLELQKEMIDAGINIVTCGNCGRVFLHRTEAIEITCPDCKLTSEPCDFPDLNF